MNLRLHLSFCACKTTRLASEILVSLCPSPHLWFLLAKQRFRSRITSLCGSQTSPMVFCIQNSDFSTRIASLYGSEPSSVVLAFKTATLGPEKLVSIGPSPHQWFLHAKQRLLDQNYKFLLVPDFAC